MPGRPLGADKEERAERERKPDAVRASLQICLKRCVHVIRSLVENQAPPDYEASNDDVNSIRRVCLH